MSGTFGETTYNDFKKSCASFLRKSKNEEHTLEELEAGLKTISIMYLGIEGELNERHTHEAVLLLEMAARPVLEAEARELTV